MTQDMIVLSVLGAFPAVVHKKNIKRSLTLDSKVKINTFVEGCAFTAEAYQSALDGTMGRCWKERWSLTYFLYDFTK